jgi:hypothetical protein
MFIHCLHFNSFCAINEINSVTPKFSHLNILYTCHHWKLIFSPISLHIMTCLGFFNLNSYIHENLIFITKNQYGKGWKMTRITRTWASFLWLINMAVLGRTILTFNITEEVRSNKTDSNDSHRKRIVSQSFSFTRL